MAKPAVIAFRLQEVIKCDVASALRHCPVPIFYLHGAPAHGVTRVPLPD
jgi:hypothetical protein